jgi:hypothetical protein
MYVSHKYIPSPSHVYYIFGMSTNSNFQCTLLFGSCIGNFPKTLLLVSRAKIQYAGDGIIKARLMTVIVH